MKHPEIVKLNIGDIVTWTSQANGIPLKKQGSVIEVVPAGKKPSTSLGHHAPGSARKHESYVVEVPQEASGSRARKPKRYWPLVSLLATSKASATLMPHAIAEESSAMSSASA